MHMFPKIRQTPWFSKSVCATLFYEHFTEINDMYWANYAGAFTLNKFKSDFCQKNPESIPIAFFSMPTKYKHKLCNDFPKWDNDYDDFLNYTRAAMLLSLSACLEIYLRGIVSLSIESCPGVVFNDSALIDGVRLLKSDEKILIFDKNHPFYRQVAEVVEGDWEKRKNSYNKYFLSMPISSAYIASLDEIRLFRNDVAHFFGREKNFNESNLLHMPVTMRKLSHEEFMHYMACVEKSVSLIDCHLYKGFIGAYEILKIYAIQLKNNLFKNDHLKSRVFKQYIGQLGLANISDKKYHELLDYYDSV